MPTLLSKIEQSKSFFPAQIPSREDPLFRDVLLFSSDGAITPIGQPSRHIAALLDKDSDKTETKRFSHLLEILRESTLSKKIEVKSQHHFKFQGFQYQMKGFLVQDPEGDQDGQAVMLIIESVTQDSPRQHNTQRYHFTPRERVVLRYIKQGLTNKEIAAMLELGVYTIKGHIKRIMHKTDIHTRSGIVGKLLMV